VQGAASGLDWRDADSYAPLLDADRSLFAWEWLRRDANYRAAAVRARSTHSGPTPPCASAEEFGLLGFEPAHLGVPDARPVWRSDHHPYVLWAEAGGVNTSSDLFDPDRLRGLVRLVAGHGCDHLLLSDGLRSIRIDGPAGTFSGGPACLRYRIEGLAAAEAPLLTLRRFLALCGSGRFSRSLHRRGAQARRWILMLRASDALAAGATQREIAATLLSRSAAEPLWRSRESSIRSQAQRLVRAARNMTDGGYRCFLR